MRFARLGDRMIALSSIRKHVGGTPGKQRFIRLFSSKGPLADLRPRAFREAVLEGKIRRLDLPAAIKDQAEDLSAHIGPTYTPQEALLVLQGIIQAHPTTMTTQEVVAS